MLLCGRGYQVGGTLRKGVPVGWYFVERGTSCVVLYKKGYQLGGTLSKGAPVGWYFIDGGTRWKVICGSGVPCGLEGTYF